ncbi:MAG: GNAT family N-acetyltransferase [Cyclobacteriaceae bacterium]
MIFRTERCHIRKLTNSDFEGFFELQSNPKVMLYTSDVVQTETACRKDLNYLISQYDVRKPSLLVYAIISDAKDFIGTCALVTGKNQIPEIGYRLCQAHWGQGYATEITKGLINYCKASLGIHQFEAYCYASNKSSLRVLEKCGFQLEEEFINPDNGLPDRRYSYNFTSLKTL